MFRFIIINFRWKKITNDEQEEWYGVFSNYLWILKQFDDHISYQIYDSTYNENGRFNMINYLANNTC